MDDLRLAVLAREQGGVITTEQLLACGLTRSGIRHRVVAGRLFPVRRGAYALSPHWDDGTLRWAAVLATDAQAAVLSHWSAAHLHRMTTTRRPEIHVTVPGSGGRSASGLTIHTPRDLGTGDVVQVDRLRVTSPERTVLDIAASAGDRVVERLIREGEFLGLLREGVMLRTVTAHPRHPGAARVRRVDPGTAEAALRQTPLEDELEALICTLPLPPPERQVTVRGLSGTAYRIDLGWSRLGLAAEADGRSAHERVSALESDRFRDNDLAGVGWVVLRFTRLQLVGRRVDSGRQLLSTATARGWRAEPPSAPRRG